MSFTMNDYYYSAPFCFYVGDGTDPVLMLPEIIRSMERAFLILIYKVQRLHFLRTMNCHYLTTISIIMALLVVRPVRVYFR